MSKPKLKHRWTRWGSREGGVSAVPDGELRVFVGERSQIDEWEVILYRDGFLNVDCVASGSGRTIDDARAQAEEAYESEITNRQK